jgi:hypothetical protein
VTSATIRVYERRCPQTFEHGRSCTNDREAPQVCLIINRITGCSDSAHTTTTRRRRKPLPCRIPAQNDIRHAKATAPELTRISLCRQRFRAVTPEVDGGANLRRSLATAVRNRACHSRRSGWVADVRVLVAEMQLLARRAGEQHTQGL